MAPIFAIIRYALLETFFCIPILPKTIIFIWLVQFRIICVIKLEVLWFWQIKLMLIL